MGPRPRRLVPRGPADDGSASSRTARRPDTRDLLERALGDADASVRYYAVRGLAAIDGAASGAKVERLHADPDVRVRLAVAAAIAGLSAP